MQRTIVIQPLNEGHTTVRMRVTELESFLQCPYSFRHKVQTTSAAMRLGTLYHKFVEKFLINKEDPKKLALEYDYSKSQLEQEHKNVMLGMMAMYIWKYKNRHNEYEVIMHEQQCVVYIHYGDILFIMSGTFDLLVRHIESGKKIMIDHKTASQKWNDYTFSKKIQKEIYPLLYEVCYPLEKTVDEFIYAVQTTKVNTEICDSRVHIVCNDEAKINLARALGFYAKCLTNDDRPTRKGMQCNRCSCKQQCPLRSNDVKVTT